MNVPTKHTSKVLQIVELLKDRKLVGTESKFKDIFNKLKELIDNSIEDPDKKIEELKKKKEEIEDEIRTIQRERKVKTYEKYQIKSRFDEVTKLTNELIGDFREVEENFKDIVRNIIEKQSEKYNIHYEKHRVCHDDKRESVWQKSWFPACTNVFAFNKTTK